MSFIDTIVSKFQGLFLDEGILLGQEQLRDLIGHKVKLVYTPPSFGLDSDHDLIEISSRITLTTPEKICHASVGQIKPITRNGEYIPENEVEIIVSDAYYRHTTKIVPGALWGARIIHEHEYTFVTLTGEKYKIYAPLYY